jgi:preprotein translocase subunit SecD
MNIKRIFAFGIVALSVALGFWLVGPSQADKPFRGFSMGLDLSGGTRLVYDVDTSKVESSDVNSAVASLHDVVERRVNTFGVSEPVVYSQTVRDQGSKTSRLVVELPNVGSLEEAQKIIGDTPVLEFRTLRKGVDLTKTTDESAIFERSKLTGEYLQRAQVQFSGSSANAGMTTASPMIGLTFNKAGAEIFADITRKHLGEPVAIYLDGELLSAPVVQNEIITGDAVITGDFTVEEAQTLAKRLNAGALPLPIALNSSEIIQPALGAGALQESVLAGVIALVVIGLFMTLWYRLPGFLASVALISYAVIMLLLFKIIPVTLSTAGIAGFIISIGIAVDANILIFERTKEEMLKGKTNEIAFLEGFARAWTSIRDSNISSLLSAIILFSFGTSLVKGFALTFGLGVIVSMLTAIGITRLYITIVTHSVRRRFWLLSGLSK